MRPRLTSTILTVLLLTGMQSSYAVERLLYFVDERTGLCFVSLEIETTNSNSSSAPGKYTSTPAGITEVPCTLKVLKQASYLKHRKPDQDVTGKD